MPTNVSSLVPPQVGSTLATVNSPQAFGSQVKDAAKQKIAIKHHTGNAFNDNSNTSLHRAADRNGCIQNNICSC